MVVSILSRAIWLLVIVGAAYLIYRSGGFNTDSLSKVGTVFDSRGGSIMILVVFTFLFFVTGMGFSYHILSMIEAKTLTSDNAMAMSMLQFVFGTAFGGVMGALINKLGGAASDKNNKEPK